MKHRWSRTMATLAVTLATVTVTACGKTPPPAPAPTTTDDAAARQADRARREAEDRARRDAEDRARREAEQRAADEARRAQQAMRTTLEQMVFFDYDMATIRPDAKRVLDAKLTVLRQNANIRLRIEGHADERGSTEYNLALGSRRAEAIRSYLTDSGIATGRLEVMSFGEERPLERGHTESSWSRNRRGEFKITAGLTADR